MMFMEMDEAKANPAASYPHASEDTHGLGNAAPQMSGVALWLAENYSNMDQIHTLSPPRSFLD